MKIHLEEFITATHKQRISFLVRLMFEISIALRSCCQPDGKSDQIPELVEFFHRLAGHASRLISSEAFLTTDYPIITMINSYVDRLSLHGALERADKYSKTMSYLDSKP